MMIALGISSPRAREDLIEAESRTGRRGLGFGSGRIPWIATIAYAGQAGDHVSLAAECGLLRGI